MNILFLSGHLPSPKARQAGQKISFYLCEYLARRHTVHLLAFSTASELQSWNRDCERVFTSHTILPVTCTRRLLGVGLAPFLPLSVAARNRVGLRRTLALLLHHTPCDVVIFDHMATWQYCNLVNGSALRVGIAHDVLSYLWLRQAKHGGGLAARFESRRLRDWERNVISSLDLICTLNNKDSALIAELGSSVQHCVLQPWFSRPPDDRPATAGKDGSLVFPGAFDRKENVDAVEFAAKDVLPRVSAAVPQCTLHLTGFASELLPRQVARNRAVQVAGYAPDLPAFLSAMQIALLPMRLGAGIKIKVLECMAAGLPVVTTPVGAEGIPGVAGGHFLVGHTAEELARHVVVLLRNRSLRVQIGEAAREFIRINYDFQASARRFEELLMLRVTTQQPALARMRGAMSEEDKLAGIPQQVRVLKDSETRLDCVTLPEKYLEPAKKAP